MANVTMTYEAMKNASSQIKTHKTNFDDMISGMTTIVNSLNGQWEGVAKEEFESAFQSLKPTLQKFSQLLERYYEELDREVADMMEKEGGSARRIGRNLSLD
jgi:WXG100 family type VII secretion target